jgi:hypothetical protein
MLDLWCSYFLNVPLPLLLNLMSPVNIFPLTAVDEAEQKLRSLLNWRQQIRSGYSLTLLYRYPQYAAHSASRDLNSKNHLPAFHTCYILSAALEAPCRCAQLFAQLPLLHTTMQTRNLDCREGGQRICHRQGLHDPKLGQVRAAGHCRAMQAT